MQYQDKEKQKRHERYLELNKKLGAPASPQPDASPAKSSILKDIVTDPIKTLLVRPADRFAEAIGRTGYLGNDIKTGYESMADSGEGRDFAGINVEQQKAGTSGLKQIAGNAAQAGSYLYGGKGIANSVENAVSGAVGRGAIHGGIVGAVGGGLYGAGESLQADESLADTASSALQGAAIGGVTGGVLGGAIPATVQGATKLAEGASNLGSKISVNGNPLNGDIIKGIRQRLTTIDPQVERVLKNTSFDELNTYLQHAENAITNPAASTPLDIAGQKAVEVKELLDKRVYDAVAGKKKVLGTFARTPIGNFGRKYQTSFKNVLGSQFGAEITGDGLRAAKNSVMKLDSADQRIVLDYFSQLKALGDAPVGKQADDFVDLWQSRLYKQNTPTSVLDPVDSRVTKMLQQELGKINGGIKDFSKKVNGNDAYAKINQRLSEHLLPMQEDLNRALGKEGSKGGSLMKRVFSPTDGGTKTLFADIKRETGIDLVKDSTLAKFVMEAVGDTRQKSLLKALDITEEALNFNPLEPGSWIRSLRRVADDQAGTAREMIRKNTPK